MAPPRRAYLVLTIMFLGLSPRPASTKASTGVELVSASGTPVRVNAHQARSHSVLAFTACQLPTSCAWSLCFEVSDRFDLLYAPKTLGWMYTVQLASLSLEFEKLSSAQVPSEASLGASHLPVNHWLGVQVFASSSARAKQQLVLPWTLPNHLCSSLSAAKVILSPVDSQLATDPVPQLARFTSSAKAEAGSLAVYTCPQPIRVTTEVSGMVLTSDVPQYTHAALQLLSYLRHPTLHSPATPQLPAAVDDTQVIINIFTRSHAAGLPGSEGPCWLDVQDTVTCKTGLYKPGTSIASAAPPPTAVALQPWVQRTNLIRDDLMYGMCLIEDTLVSNKSFTSRPDGAVLTGQFTLNAQGIARYSNYMQSIAALVADFNLTMTRVLSSV